MYFITRPIAKKSPGDTSEIIEKEDPNEGNSDKKLSQAELAFLDWQAWKNNTSSSLKEIDERLNELNDNFPESYRFTLERIRGAAKIKGVHSHKEEFALLIEAAKTAIECKCDDAKKMLDDLRKHQNDKANGFWKLSTHPKQWNPVIEALEKEDIEFLEQVDSAHH